jgi:hypothetical protein
MSGGGFFCFVIQGDTQNSSTVAPAALEALRFDGAATDECPLLA